MLTLQDRQYWVGAFFRNIQQSCRLIYWAAIADRPRLTPEWIDDMLEKNHGWLTPQTAAHYEAAAFDFLSPEELQRLTDSVGQVRAVAGELGPNDTASAEQRERAKLAFKAVLQLLEFDRFDDPEAFRLGKMIERKLAAGWPPHLDHLRFRTGYDSTEDPALWVWGYVAQVGEYDEQTFLEWASDIRRVVAPVAREFAPEGRAFLRLRSTIDQAELEGAAA